ncbi:MAG: TonB-dependent receptor [Microscillaceae bacterium]|nr:TonB-dependent receptor [Microscillaceae bacterium]
MLTNQEKYFIGILLQISSVIIFLNLAQAQEPVGRIIGKITEAQAGEALSYANIRIFSQADSTLFTGTVADDKGLFALEIAYGRYYAVVDFLGFLPIQISDIILSHNQPQYDMGTVRLMPNTKSLDEVVVQAEKSTLELSLDKKIFNVGKDLSNAGGSAIEILSNIPSVVVDVEGNVKLRGSDNVRILIDGKPSGLVSFKGGSGLQQLQGSMVERVEIITNPSARYEAEGMSGIINIILKKDRQKGFNGSFEIITGTPTNFGGAANVNYRHKKINFFINYGITYRIQPSINRLYQEVYVNDTTFVLDQDFDGRQKGFNTNIRGGMDFFFTEKSILTASYLYRRSKGKRITDILYNDYLFELDPQNLSSFTKRRQDEDETEPNSEYVLSYKKTFVRKGHELNAEIRHLDNWESSNQLYTQNTFSPDGGLVDSLGLVQISLNDESEKQWLFQTDYVHPFAKEGKFEAGFRFSFRNMLNEFIVSEEDEFGVFQPLPGLDNDFEYNENINAIYGIIGNKSGKFSYQFGLRAEWTDIKTVLRQTQEENPRNYANLFPSVHFTYDFPQENALQLSYSRRIRRPFYNDLTPFVTFSDNRNYFSGNPDLNPEYSHAFELGHIKYFEKASVTSSVYYRYTEGKILRIRSVNDEGFSTTLPENLATENSYGLELTGDYNPITWWKLTMNANFFRAVIDGSNLDASLASKTYSWFVRHSSRFTLPKNIDIQFRASYEAPQTTPQGRQLALTYMDFAMSKDIFKGKGTLTLNVIDVFNSRKLRTINEGDNFYSRGNSQWRRRQINLTFNYRLNQSGKAKKNPLGEEGGS